MPVLTISMPAFNSALHIRQAVESVLRQEDVDFELVVVDDGSQDGTAGIVEGFADPRIRLLRNPENRGIGYCHNRVTRASTSPFIAHVDSDDFLLPGALARMLSTLATAPDVFCAHCNYMFVDNRGKPTDRASLRNRNDFLRARKGNINYRRDLVIHGGEATNHLRTYRRRAFELVGGFDEKLRYGEDLHMALRIADRGRLMLVPEVLYCKRVHRGCVTESLRFQTARFLLNRWMICRGLRRNGEVAFLNQRSYGLSHLMILSLLHNLRSIYARGDPRTGIL